MKRIFGGAAAVIWLGLSLSTITGYPAVWVDEILSADAGIHLAQGKGFVSAGWFNQPSWEFWASYPPLYAFVLAGWLKIFGISALVVRSFGLALVTASLAMVWLFQRCIAKGLSKWPLVAALAVCEPVAFLERAGRPDSVSLFLLCATAWILVVERGWRWRSPLIFVLGLLAVPAALQYAAGAILLMVLVQIWFKPFERRDVILWSTGAITGTAALTLLYIAHHVLKIFIESTLASKHSSAGRLLQNLVLGHGETPFVFSNIVTAPLRDYATPAVILFGFFTWWVAKRRNQPLARRLSSFGVVCGVLIPVAIQLLGKYPIYYAYLGAVPATVAIVTASEYLGGKMRWLNAVLCLFLFAGGAGRFWWKAWNQGAQDAVRPQAISANDTVVSDYPAYYELLGNVRELFAVGYAGGKVMPNYPASQAERVNRIIVRNSLFGDVSKKVGGQWQRVADLTVVRHKVATTSVIIDDDTGHPDDELIGVYARIPSTSGERK